MQENLPVTPSIPEQVNPVVQVNNQKPKTNSFLVILLSVLLLISLSIAGFFAFQTQTLVAELNSLKIEPTQTAEAAAEPTISSFSTNDLISGWKTYNNEGLFTFNYPKEYTESGMGIMSPLNPVRNQKDSTLQGGELKLEFYSETFEGDMTVESCWKDHNSSGGEILSKGKINVGNLSYETIIWQGLGTGEFTCVVNNGYRILINKYPAETTRQNEYEDILSTFRFTN